MLYIYTHREKIILTQIKVDNRLKNHENTIDRLKSASLLKKSDEKKIQDYKELIIKEREKKKKLKELEDNEIL